MKTLLAPCSHRSPVPSCPVLSCPVSSCPIPAEEDGCHGASRKLQEPVSRFVCWSSRTWFSGSPRRRPGASGSWFLPEFLDSSSWSGDGGMEGGGVSEHHLPLLRSPVALHPSLCLSAGVSNGGGGSSINHRRVPCPVPCPVPERRCSACRRLTAPPFIFPLTHSLPEETLELFSLGRDNNTAARLLV